MITTNVIVTEMVEIIVIVEIEEVETIEIAAIMTENMIVIADQAGMITTIVVIEIGVIATVIEGMIAITNGIAQEIMIETMIAVIIVEIVQAEIIKKIITNPKKIGILRSLPTRSRRNLLNLMFQQQILPSK